MYRALISIRKDGHTLRRHELQSTFSGENASPGVVAGYHGVWLHGFEKSEELVEAVLNTFALMKVHGLDLGAIVCTGIKSYDALSEGLPEIMLDYLIFEQR